MLVPLIGLVVPLVVGVIAAVIIAPPAAGAPAAPAAVGLLAGLAVMLLGAAAVMLAGLVEPPMPALALLLIIAAPVVPMVLGAAPGLLAPLEAGGSALPHAAATSHGATSM